jgi:hypothetical protein
MHIIPHNLLSYECMWDHSCCLTPHRSRTCTTGWGAWRMLWWVREWSRLSSLSQLWVAGPLSPYNVFIYFVQELLLCSKDVTFDHVPWFIICVRLGPSTPGDYVRARVLVPRNLGVTFLLSKWLVIKARDTKCVVVLVGSKWPVWLRRKLTRSRWPFERGKGLKETQSLWPPHRGLGSLEPNLGKTNHRVTRFIFLVDLFSPLSWAWILF